MKYEVAKSGQYKKDYKLLLRQRRDVSLLDAVIETLENGETLAPKYRDHALHGKWEGFRECHISPDWLLVYMIDNGTLVLTLMRTGSHAHILGM